jgi:hypothetical protein
VDVGNLNQKAIARRSPRRSYEGSNMGEPLFAAWVVALAHNRQVSEMARGDMMAAFQHYRWPGLYMSLFFAAEGAYYESLRTGGVPA